MKDRNPGMISLKFVQPSRVRLQDGKLVTLSGSEEEKEALSEVLEVLKKYKVVKIRGDSFSEEVERKLSGGREERTDFNLAYHLYIEHLSNEKKVELLNALNACDFVELADFYGEFALLSLLPKGPLIRGLAGSMLAQNGHYSGARGGELESRPR